MLEIFWKLSKCDVHADIRPFHKLIFINLKIYQNLLQIGWLVDLLKYYNKIPALKTRDLAKDPDD